MMLRPLAVLLMLGLGVRAPAAAPPDTANLTAVLTENQSKGRALFTESCSFCHGERGHATSLLAKRLGPENAVLEQRTNLSADLIRHVVRRGINSMPWYRRAELSDRELELIVTYLTRPKSGQ